MDDRLYLIDLYDLYKELLTEKQCLCFVKYYFEDLTLAEISEELGVSRALASKTLKVAKEHLLKYESIIKKGALRIYINTLEHETIRSELERFL